MKSETDSDNIWIWDKEECDYDLWAVFDKHYECEMKKEVPMLIMNSMRDHV